MGPAAGDGWDWFISYRHLTHSPGLSLRRQTNSHLESGHEGDEGVHLPTSPVILIPFTSFNLYRTLPIVVLSVGLEIIAAPPLTLDQDSLYLIRLLAGLLLITPGIVTGSLNYPKHTADFTL